MTDSLQPPPGVPGGAFGLAADPDIDPAGVDWVMEAAAARLAAADADAIRQEGPRSDTRIGLLLSLLLGGAASASVFGGLGTELAHARHAYVATGLLAAAAVVVVVGLVLIVGLILPRLSRRVTAQSGVLAQVANLPGHQAVREFYRAAAIDPLGHQVRAVRSHAVGIQRRLYRLRRAGWVLVAGIVLATAGWLALGWGG